MPLPDILLDDRKFDALFNELRRRIPVYTPEWTDHNESDPGITLLQLFAYLQEILLWRLNRVPEKNYVKFLELVGMDLQLATPAHTELTFTLVKGATETTIPAGTRVSMAGGGDGPPVIFETDDNLAATSVQFMAAQSFDGAQYTLFPAPDSGAPPSLAFGPAPQRDSVFYIAFDTPFPPGQQSITLHISSSLDVPAVQAGDPGVLDVAPPITAVWEYWSGDQSGWKPLELDRDDTHALLRSGAMVFETPLLPDGKTSAQQPRKLGLLKQDTDTAFYWLRYRIVELLGDGYENAPQIEAVLLNTIGATNAVTEREELLGSATGLPSQTFQLSQFPVLPLDPGITGRIAVDEGDGNGFVTWKEVQNFNQSTRDDQHYMLNLATGLVTFGDGQKGANPRWLSSDGSNRTDADIANVKAVQYRWGGGAQGNGDAGTVTQLQSPVAFVESVTNVVPAVGGQDEETVPDVEDRAPMQLRTATRAVTGDDFAFLATQTPGARIKRAQAFPLLNPSFRMKRTGASGIASAEVPIPGCITVVVVPDSADNVKPMPSAATLQLVGQYLDKYRLLTSELFVAAPHYRQLYIEGRVIAKPTADAGVVMQNVNQRLLDYFHPLKGGPNQTGWDFGGTVYFSETFRQILETDGVLRIDTASIKTFLDDVQQPPCQDVSLEPDELLYSTGHNIQVNYE